MNPEARVYRPQSETLNQLIDKLMQVRTAEGHIQRPSWTLYISWLLNRELGEVRTRYKQRVGG